MDVAQKFAALTVTAPTAPLSTGGTTQLTPVPRDARGAAMPAAVSPTFTTSARSAALVDSTGLVTAIAPGSTTITASLTRDGAPRPALPWSR